MSEASANESGCAAARAGRAVGGPVLRFSEPASALAWTGERFVSSLRGDIRLEHHHRYLLAAALCAGRDVLDVACGEGYGSALLASVARGVVGVDSDAGTIEFARGAYAAANLRFEAGSIEQLPLESASFDVVVCFETIEHVREQDRALDELRRVLRPGGVCVISTPERTRYRAGQEPNRFHTHEYTAAEFEATLRTRFAHVRVLGQRVVSGSLIVPEGSASAVEALVTQDGASYEPGPAMGQAEYLIAVCSDGRLPEVPASIADDRRYSPGAQDEGARARERAEAAARSAQQAEQAARAEAQRERAQTGRATQELAALRDAVARSEAAHQTRLLTEHARADAAERAVGALRAELAELAVVQRRAEAERSAATHAAAEAAAKAAMETAKAAEREAELRGTIAGVEAALAVEQRRAGQFAAEVARLTASRSWRWTAPLRAVGRAVRRMLGRSGPG